MRFAAAARQLTAAAPPDRLYPGTHSALDGDPDRVAEPSEGEMILVPSDGVISLDGRTYTGTLSEWS
jgi:hypothetical protein